MDDKCYCRRCLKERDERINGIPVAMCRMIVCPDCGDKRCPKAEDHRNACTPMHTVRRPTEEDRLRSDISNLRARVAELEHFAQQVYDEAQEQHLVAQAALMLHPLQP